MHGRRLKGIIILNKDIYRRSVSTKEGDLVVLADLRHWVVNRMRKCNIRHSRAKQRVEGTPGESEANRGSIQSRISLSLCIP
jgi:hypothetical protein